jgi:glycerophosphoryl diester phosphodiesterase
MGRTTRRAAVAAAGIIACATPGVPAPAAFDAQGHRCARGLRPENSLPACMLALELGVSTLELDLGVTRDRIVVIAHDPYVPPAICGQRDGTPIAGERGPLLRDLTLAELREYDCGARNPDPHRFSSPPWQPRPGSPMPTLAEVFDLVAERGERSVRFNLETKLQPGDRETLPAREFVSLVIDLVERRGLAPRVSIQSFDWRALAIAKELAPEIERVALLAPDTLRPEWLNGLRPETYADPQALLIAARSLADVASPHWRMLLADETPPALSVAALQAAGYRVVPWTVNDEPTMRALIRLGVDGLISDRPDRLLSVLRSQGIPLR